MATQRTADAARYLTGPAYGIAALFVLLPIIDTLAQVWPVALGNPAWRYGTIGLGANYLISVLFGMLGLCLLAALGSHRRTLRALTILSGVAALLLLIAALAFLLDALQLRGTVPRDNPRTLWMFDAGAAKAAFKYLVSAAVFGWLALATWRAGRAIPRPAADEVAPKLVHEQKGRE
jgi:hypothetical protein